MIILRYGYQNSNLFFRFFLITVCSCFSALLTASNFASLFMHTHTRARARTCTHTHTRAYTCTHAYRCAHPKCCISFFRYFLQAAIFFLKKIFFHEQYSQPISFTHIRTHRHGHMHNHRYAHALMPGCLVVGVFFFTRVSFFSSFTAAKTRPTPTLFRPQNHTHTLTCWMHHL